MTRKTPIAQLTTLLQQQALAELAQRRQDSERVANALATLTEMDRMARHVPGGTAAASGAGTAWQEWARQRRQDLQRDAALARAAELQVLGQTALAFGRNSAIEALEREQAGMKQDRARKRALDEMARLGVMASIGRDDGPL